MFYVWANKVGTCRDSRGALCVAGNYFPCWTAETITYEVLDQWPQTLWRQYQINHETWEEYLFKCRSPGLI